MNSLFPLFEPLRVGAMEVPNRLFMAPLTRCRAEAGHVPGQLMAEYYAQRATAGLIIAEATMVMEGNSAFYAEPGIYSEAQVAGSLRRLKGKPGAFVARSDRGGIRGVGSGSCRPARLAVEQFQQYER
jgi:2,4-dienoyl-CoA reductase-like NADH-dependent reductase (Old Yellow Enzyme family)